MATFKHTGGVSPFRDKLIGGMVARGYAPAFAERTFAQLEGFGSYGFPESHAASFALVAYASSWLKCWHPDVFCAALLNAQPMGFYAPAQIVRDARDHGVEMRPITQDTTTLYASDRDVFLFLVDDLNPIEAGRLPDGSPDLYFRGFYCWNSEVGAKTLGMASFYLRAVCQNRNLWGVEDFEEITIRHSKYAASRFAHEAAPALTRFANSSPAPFIDGIRQARARIVARTDEDRADFLRKRGFGKAETAKILDRVLTEEGRKPESVFDFVQGITAVARDKTHQDARLDLEGRAKKLLDRAA